MSKCTPVCIDDCQRDHHPLLKALIDVVDEDSLSTFKNVIEDFSSKDGSKLLEKLDDPTQELAKPILHLTAALGKKDVLALLQKTPFKMDPTKSLSDDNQTALHYSLSMWKTKAIYSLDAINVVDQLKSCLNFINDSSETPLHICASNLLSASKKNVLFWRSIFKKMINLITDLNLDDILDSKDQDGNTILHILSKNDSFLDLVGILLSAGADLRLKNIEKESPVDVAKSFAPAIYNSFNMILTEIGVNQFYQRNIRCNTRNSKKVIKNVKKEISNDADDDDDSTPNKRPRLDNNRSMLADQHVPVSKLSNKKPCSSKCSELKIYVKKEQVASETYNKKDKLNMLSEEISDVFKCIFEMYKID